MQEYKNKELLQRKNRPDMPALMHEIMEANDIFINDEKAVVI